MSAELVASVPRTGPARHLVVMAAGTGGHVMPGLAVARELLAAEAGTRPYRLIGAGLSDFVDAAEGLDLFADEERRARSSETAIDALRARFGADAIMTGRALKPGKQ